MLGFAERPNGSLLYETSYQLLSDLIPNVRTAICNSVRTEDGRLELSFVVVERAKYTSTLIISVVAWPYKNFVEPVVMKVRMYHDADVAEVTEFQGKGKFRSSYDYPNVNMFLPNEKRQVNLFLFDVLIVCGRCELNFSSENLSSS